MPCDATTPEEIKRLRVKTQFKVKFPVPVDGSEGKWTVVQAWVMEKLDEDIVIGLLALRRGKLLFLPARGDPLVVREDPREPVPKEGTQTAFGGRTPWLVRKDQEKGAVTKWKHARTTY